MGNWAYFCGSPIDHLPVDEAEMRRVADCPGRTFEVKNVVPVFWLAMFEPADWRVGRMYKEQDDEAYLVTPVETALARLDARGAGLQAFIGPAHAPLFAAFRALVRSEMRGFAVLRLGSVVEPSSEKHVRAALTAVAAFARSTAITKAHPSLDSLCGLHPRFREVEQVVGILSGYAPEWPVPDELAVFAPEPIAHDALARYLEQPWDQTRWQACLEELQARDDHRAWLMSWEQRGGPADFTAAGDLRRILLGPLTPYIDDLSNFRRGFLDVAKLKAPRELLRGKPFLQTLEAGGAALLAHPLWRTVRELRGEDDDVIACCQHPNFVSLTSVSLTAGGLSRLSDAPKPVQVRAATFLYFGLAPEPRAAWKGALQIGALTSLRELTLNACAAGEGAPLLEPEELSWLLESPLGDQLEHLTLVTGQHSQRTYRLVDWLPIVAGSKRRISFTLALPATSMEMTLQHTADGVSVHVATRLGFPGHKEQDVTIAERLVAAAIKGLPAGTRCTVSHDSHSGGGVPLDPRASADDVAIAVENFKLHERYREEERIWVELFAEVLAIQFGKL